MVDFDLKSYTSLYLKNAVEEVETLRGLIREGKDIATMHRLAHSLKGQSYFMNLKEIGDFALQLETFFKTILDQGQTTLTNPDIPNNTLNRIESLILAIKI